MRPNLAIWIVCVATLFACAEQQAVVRHNTTADARPFERNNLPVSDTVAADATADGLKLRENGRNKTEPQPTNAEPAPPKPSTSTGTPTAAVPSDPDDGE